MTHILYTMFLVYMGLIAIVLTLGALSLIGKMLTFEITWHQVGRWVRKQTSKNT